MWIADPHSFTVHSSAVWLLGYHVFRLILWFIAVRALAAYRLMLGNLYIFDLCEKSLVSSACISQLACGGYLLFIARCPNWCAFSLFARVGGHSIVVGFRWPFLKRILRYLFREMRNYPNGMAISRAPWGRWAPHQSFHAPPWWWMLYIYFMIYIPCAPDPYLYPPSRVFSVWHVLLMRFVECTAAGGWISDVGIDGI